MLNREEFVEQAHFFRAFAARMAEGVAAQEALKLIAEEVLATTKLPMAISYLVGEMKLVGTLATAMARISHYFTPFQTFVIAAAEEEEGRFDMRIALAILEQEAIYRSNDASPQGLFFYRFECLSRNRLDYSRGLTAIANDPLFDQAWREWIEAVGRQVGVIDLEARAATAAGREPPSADRPILFGNREGRIARANRGKDPLHFFAALQRQLDYPLVPRPKRPAPPEETPALLSRRLERLEMRVKLLEEESRGGIDLSRFDPKNIPSPFDGM